MGGWWNTEQVLALAPDSAVVDLADQLADPVEVLFGTQLGGGTDINGVIGYCEGLITRPRDSIFVLISDLIEGGIREQMLTRIASMVDSGACTPDAFPDLLALAIEGGDIAGRAERREMAAR